MQENQQQPQAPITLPDNFIFKIDLNIHQVNLVINALAEAPHKFAKDPTQMLLDICIPQQDAELARLKAEASKPILHTV